MAPRRLLTAAAAAAALTLASSAAPPARYTTIGINTVSQDAMTVQVQVLAPGAAGGVAASGPNVTVLAPQMFPCSNAFIPSATGGAGEFVLVSNGSAALTFVSAVNGSVLRTMPLTPPYQLPLIAFWPPPAGDGRLYAIGAPVGGSAFMELVSVDPSTGALTGVAPILIEDVLPCGAYSLDPASGLMVFAYVGPLQMQVLGGLVVSNKSSAQGFNVAVANGTLQAMAPLPPAADGNQAVLFIAQDGLGSLQALQAMDAASGNTSVLVPLPVNFVNANPGALTYDAPSQTAAVVAGFVQGDGTTDDVLLTFSLAGLQRGSDGTWALPGGGAGAWASTTLGVAGADAAPQGFFNIAPL